MVSQAPFDYLHGIYENTGIIWIDAHPDVSTVKDGYPNAHAMVLDASLFHSTYFANKDLVGDRSGSGKMTMEKLTAALKCITE